MMSATRVRRITDDDDIEGPLVEDGIFDIVDIPHTTRGDGSGSSRVYDDFIVDDDVEDENDEYEELEEEEDQSQGSETDD